MGYVCVYDGLDVVGFGGMVVTPGKMMVATTGDGDGDGDGDGSCRICI